MKTIRRGTGQATTIQCEWLNPHAADGCATAVSLHSHSQHSREYLDFLPRLLPRLPVAGVLPRLLGVCRAGGEKERYHCQHLFWRPPLTPRAAYELEAGQIAGKLGRRPLVSITDHDDIDAPAQLRAAGLAVPYSVEWTLPFEATVFHIGVHNLPPGQARSLLDEMNFTAAAGCERRLGRMLADLDRMEDVLLVLNHPFNNEARVARRPHLRLLKRFLDAFGSRLHALELNAMQPVSDNRKVLKLSAERGLPLVSGGDRHCLEPNANLNLTNARNFTEFVHEVRRDGLSRILFLSQYREPLAVRYIESVWQAVKTYPELRGRERWPDRVFYEHERDGAMPLSALWPSGSPVLLRHLIGAVGFLANPWTRHLLRLAIGEHESVAG